MSEEESIIWDKFKAEKDEKRKEKLYDELHRLRKIREEKEAALEESRRLSREQEEEFLAL